MGDETFTQKLKRLNMYNTSLDEMISEIDHLRTTRATDSLMVEMAASVTNQQKNPPVKAGWSQLNSN